MSSPVVLGGTLYIPFGTSSASTGAATNADSTPVVTVYDNGSAMGYSPTVSNLATGLYMATILASGANGFTAGHRYSVSVSATVSTINGQDGIDEFEVIANDLNAIPTAAQNATAVLSAASAAPISCHVKIINNVVLAGAGVPGNPMRPA